MTPPSPDLVIDPQRMFDEYHDRWIAAEKQTIMLGAAVKQLRAQVASLEVRLAEQAPDPIDRPQGDAP